MKSKRQRLQQWTIQLNGPNIFKLLGRIAKKSQETNSPVSDTRLSPTAGTEYLKYTEA